MSIRDGICPECGHTEIIETLMVEFGSNDAERTMQVTYNPRWRRPGHDPAHGYGPLYLYTCRSCGLSKWYARNPGGIPIGPDFKTRLING